MCGSVRVHSSGLGVLFYLNWKITFLVLVGLPVYALTFYLIKPPLRRASIAQRRLNASLYARAAERISGVQVVKAFCMEKGELRAFARRVVQGLRVQLRLIFYQRALVLTAGIIAALTTGLTSSIRHQETSLSTSAAMISVAFSISPSRCFRFKRETPVRSSILYRKTLSICLAAGSTSRGTAISMMTSGSSGRLLIAACR